MIIFVLINSVNIYKIKIIGGKKGNIDINILIMGS